MHPRLKKCLKCGKPMHLIPMQSGRFKCGGWLAQCTDCDYSYGMEDMDFGDAIRFYNGLENNHESYVPRFVYCFAATLAWLGASRFTNNGDAELLSLLVAALFFVSGVVLVMLRITR